jgi:hypothetical protein
MNFSVVFATFLVFCVVSLSFAAEQKSSKPLSRKNSCEKIELPADHVVTEGRKPSQCPFLRALKQREAEEKRAKAAEPETKK